MLKILEEYGAPPNSETASKDCTPNLKVILKIGKEKAEIDQEV